MSNEIDKAYATSFLDDDDDDDDNYNKMSNCFVNNLGNTICHNDGWAAWGRWILLAAILVFAFAIYLLFA